MTLSPPASMSIVGHKVHTVWDLSAVWLLSGCRAAPPRIASATRVLHEANAVFV